jgi:hypothetical protein
MSIGKIITLGVVVLVLLFVSIGVGSAISFSNSQIELRNQFDQKFSERTTFYDKMYKTISQKTQIALKNDSSFRENINIIMSGRKDGENIMMKWVKETNPNSDYAQASLYKDLSRAVEAQREGFFVQEKFMQDIVLQHSNLIQRFPGSFYNLFFGYKKIDYKPITSTITDEVIKTGKDDNVKLF